MVLHYQQWPVTDKPFFLLRPGDIIQAGYVTSWQFSHATGYVV